MFSLKEYKTVRKFGILERLKKGIVLGGEGYIFELERRGYVKAGAFVPEVILDHPEAVLELHKEFLRAGVEVMVALTYYAHRAKLKLIGREEEIERLNTVAVKLAKKVAKEGDCLVAGNICNTWIYNPKDKKSFSKVRKMYQEQIGWAVSEGIDFVIGETLEYVGEALIALEVIKGFKLPAMITFAAVHSKSKDGYSWEEACEILEKEGADIVGLNCARGPKTMLPILKRIRKRVKGYLAAQPVPYYTNFKHPAFQFLENRFSKNRFSKNKIKRGFPTELDTHLLSRSDMADFASQAAYLGINYIGICCGGAPHHLRAMAESLGRVTLASKYSPDMSQHGMFGSKKVVSRHEAKFLKHWKI